MNGPRGKADRGAELDSTDADGKERPDSFIQPKFNPLFTFECGEILT